MIKKLYIRSKIDPITGFKTVDQSFTPYISYEDDFVKVETIQNPPEIVNTDNRVGKYIFDNYGNLNVEYTSIDSSQTEQMKNQIDTVTNILGIYTPPMEIIDKEAKQ